MLKITSEINLIKIIIKQMAADKKGAGEGSLRLDRMNWEEFKELIIYHEMAPFAHPALKDLDLSLPSGLGEFLKNNYYCALARCQNIWQEFLRIAKAFEEAGVIIAPIKGVALLEDIYAQKAVRPMTDIDLLVREEDLLKAEGVFCSLGYRKELYGLKEAYWRKNQCHIAFYKKEDEKAPFLELHWGLDFKRKGRAILTELWQRIRGIKVDDRTIKLLSPEDTLFSLALHNRRFGRTLCLKNAYDTVLLLNKYELSFDWDYVLRQSRKYAVCSTIYFILSQAKLLSELNIPEFVWGKLNLSTCKRRLIQQFIERNTFSPDINKRGRELYLRSHFLLYDTFWEPLKYIFNIPEEQFAKFYGLESYAEKTGLLYKNRLLYIPFKAVLNTLKPQSK